MANVTERVLFPGLDGLSRWLAHLAVPVTENGLTDMLVDGQRNEGFDMIWGAATSL